jgi:myosin heavy subunit
MKCAIRSITPSATAAAGTGAAPRSSPLAAGGCRYTCLGWVEKNRDPLPPALRALLARSADPFTRDVTASLAGAADAAAAAGRGGAPTVAARFRASLGELVGQIGQGQLHFLRCINPNTAQRARLVDAPYLLAQLRYA